MVRFFQLGMACAVILFAITGQSKASSLTNGNFETGDFTGWSVGIDPGYDSGGRPYNVDSAGDGWAISTGFNGSSSARNGFDGGVVDGNGIQLNEADLNFFLNQDFSFSDSVTSASLNFVFDITGGPGFSASRSGAPTEDRVFTASLLSGGVNVSTLYTYTVLGTTSDRNPLQNVSIDIASALNTLGAGTYTLAFNELIPQYFTGGANFYIDNISLNIETEAVPTPTASLAGLLGFGVMAAMRRKRKA